MNASGHPSAPPPEQVADGLEHRVEIVTYGLLALIDQALSNME